MLYFGKSAHADISVNELAGFCRMNNIPFYAEDDKKELYNWQQLNEPDVIFITGYAHKIAVEELSSVPKGIFNIHFGKLPQYRGPSPVFWQLKNGEAQLGLAIHQLTNKLDSGAVAWEQNIKNEEYYTYSYINQAFSQLQVQGVSQILNQFSNKQTLDYKIQDETEARYYKKPQLADVVINWDTMDTKQILDLIKACTAWNNGASTIINGYELKILDAEPASSEANFKPGTISIANNKFSVACINKQVLIINFFYINNTCIPARHAGFYGLKQGKNLQVKYNGAAGQNKYNVKISIMKTLLLIAKKVTTNSRKFVPAIALLLMLLGITQSMHAQVYYLQNSGKGNVSDAANAIKKIDYTGSNDANVTTGFPNPSLFELDLPNNRAFTFNGFLGSRVINVVRMTDGVVTNTISLPAAIQASGYSVTAIKYDPINDWVYYITNSGTGTANDMNAIYRSKPDGTQNTVLAKQFALLPIWLSLDIPNNRVFIYEGIYTGRKMLTFNLGTNTVTANPSISNIVNAIAYDDVTDYIYYITSDNDQLNNGTTNGTTNDALRKIHPDGTGGEVVVRSSLVISPQYMALDAGNNRAYVYNGYYGSSGTIRISTTGIYSVDLTSGTTVLKLDHSGLQNTPNYIRIYGLFAPARPIISTTAVSTFSSSTATLGGNVSRSDAAVTARGVVYSSSNNTPTISGSGVTQASSGTGTGSFTASISSLSASTTYYVRSYATSGAGTTYGAVQSFTTQSNDATLSGLTISAGTLNPTFSSATITYTATVANSNSSITITPTRNNAGASIQVNNIAATSGVGSSVNLNIGDNAIPVKVTAADGSTTKTYTITVTRPKAAQTITFAGTATKTYGDADFAPGASASSGLGVSYSSDNLGVATIVSGQIHIVGSGTANITASQAGDGNYLAAGNAVQALTVNKASQTITFNAIPAKTYGTADFAPGATSSAGLTVSYASDNSLVATIVSNQVHIVGQGTANITASQAGDANRLAATSVVQSLTVNKVTVTITANAQTKIYGADDPAFTYTATGVVGADAPTGALSRVNPNTNRLIGTYAIDQGTLSYGGNYNITYVSANLTINKRPITVLPSAKTKVYGDADPFLNQYSIPAGSLAPGDGSSDQFGRAPGESVGTYLMSLGNKIVVNGNDIVTANYDITVQPAYFTITAKPVIVSANAQTKTYGDADPALSYVNDSLPFGDTFSGSLTRAPGEGFGTYAITQGTLALSSNYTLTFNGNNLTIGKKTINVTANAKTKTYGTADPAFDYTYDALSFSDGFTGALTRDAGEDVGNHAINQGSLALSSNYTLNYTGANLSIGKSTLTYVAAPASRPYLTTDPTYTGSVTGFVNGDNQASATSGTLSFTTTANINSPLGNYPIVGSGLSAANYNFVQDASNATALTITPSIDATLANLTVDQGTLNPVFSSEQTSYGFAVANNVASFNLTATVNQPNATLNFNGSTITSGIATNVPLNTGSNNINVIVTAQDGSTTKYYTLNIFRAYDTNNMLASLNLNGVTYSPTFDTNTLIYTASVSNLVTSTDVTATAVSPTTHIFVGGYDLATTNPVTTSLNVGETDVIVVSKAENGDERIYKVTVTRAQSSDATLASIGNSSITLNTPFTASTHTYSATVPSETGALTFKPVSTNDRATILVNTQALNPGPGNNVNLGFGNNAVTIDVTSEDGTSHGTYTVNIYRLRSSNANLASLSFPFITSLNEEFNPNVYEYTATVADSTYTGIPLTAISASENAIVKIDGTVVPRFQNYTLPVHGGPNTYHVVVTSQDTSVTKTYTLVLTRAGTPPPAQSPVANLYALNVNATGFSKNFNFTTGDVLTTINTPNSIAAVRIFAVSENQVSTVTVDGVTLPYDATTDLLPITVGDNVFTVVVTSEDGAHTKTYDVHVNRLPFADVTLASLSINAGTLTPTFVPATRSYTVSVPNNITSIGVTPVATVGTATIKIGATQISASNPTATVDLFEGPPNRIRVVVTAADGVTTQTYSVNVTREAPIALSNNAVASLRLTPSSTLVKTSSSGSTVNYSTSVDPGTSSVIITPTAQDVNASVLINGAAVVSGTASDPIALNIGSTIITVNVTAQDGVTVNTYSITVTRTGSNNAVASLRLTPSSTLVKTSSSGSTVNYSTSVDPGTSSVIITPTAQDVNASVLINGAAVVSGTASDPIALNIGSTIITVNVTAQDGVTVNTYSINVIRPTNLLMVDKNDSKFLFANKAANNIAPAGDDGVVVHQGISPNGDGSNDFLYIEGISAYPGNKLSIMNTSGTLVFDAKDYGKDGNHVFDGHSNKNGALLKPGTYFYALEYQVDKQSKRKTGYIIIKY
nr:cadherin-like beta sandwich domain-containing protein [Mucilaginibacter sp. L294]